VSEIPPVAAAEETEQERVRLWRLERALSLGLDMDTAETFAAGDGDLHQLERLIDAGCDPPVAARIAG
jgi:hypothetical protein